METFSLSPAYVKSVSSTTVPVGTYSSYPNSHLISFLLSLNTEGSTTANGSEDVNAYAYRFDGSSFTPGDQGALSTNTVDSCLSLQAPCQLPLGVKPSDWPENLQSLLVCLSDGHRTAQITITSAGGVGATTKLDYVNC
jgi:hypothetical protein